MSQGVVWRVMLGFDSADLPAAIVLAERRFQNIDAVGDA